MMPFYYEELEKLMKSILENILKSGKLGDSPTTKEMVLLEINNDDESHCLQACQCGPCCKIRFEEAKTFRFQNTRVQKHTKG